MNPLGIHAPEVDAAMTRRVLGRPPTERGRLVAALRRLAERAQRGGVTIGVEA